MPGYQVEWYKSNKASGKTIVIEKDKTMLTQNSANNGNDLNPIEPSQIEEENLTASNNNQEILSSIETEKLYNEQNSTPQNSIKSIKQKNKTHKNDINSKNKEQIPITEEDPMPIENHWAAITSFITGIGGIVLIPIILSISAIIFCAIALAAIKKNPEKYKGKGFAIAGLVLGIIGLIWVALFFIILLGALAAA